MNNGTKLFSIIICTYNGERYLDKCLDGILKLKGLEELVDKVVVVDNNSKDNTKLIIEKYASMSSKIKYEFEEKQGLSFARAHAVRANTPWVVYADDDNILEKEWLYELHKCIVENSKLGVVNGAVIATAETVLTHAEKMMLKVMYRNLACTHLEEPTLHEPKNKTPMGAGMCVRTEALKAIYDEGWLKLKGRNGEKLSSGEDTELSERIIEKGYEYYCNYKMKLYHIIPKERLTESYTRKLIRGLVEGRVAFLKGRRGGKFKCGLRVVKYVFVYGYTTLLSCFYSDKYEQYWKNKVDRLQAEAFLSVIIGWRR